jgi:hypothetical protein
MTQKNWLLAAEKAICESVPEAVPDAVALGEHLGVLVLFRLPAACGKQLLELLPEVPMRFQLYALSYDDRSIGYPDFVERALHVLSFSSSAPSCTRDEREKVARRIADAFLGAFGEDLPEEAKAMLLGNLPTELLCRTRLKPGLRAAS